MVVIIATTQSKRTEALVKVFGKCVCRIVGEFEASMEGRDDFQTPSRSLLTRLILLDNLVLKGTERALFCGGSNDQPVGDVLVVVLVSKSRHAECHDDGLIVKLQVVC